MNHCDKKAKYSTEKLLKWIIFLQQPIKIDYQVISIYLTLKLQNSFSLAEKKTVPPAYSLSNPNITFFCSPIRNRPILLLTFYAFDSKKLYFKNKIIIKLNYYLLPGDWLVVNSSCWVFEVAMEKSTFLTVHTMSLLWTELCPLPIHMLEP